MRRGRARRAPSSRKRIADRYANFLTKSATHPRRRSARRYGSTPSHPMRICRGFNDGALFARWLQLGAGHFRQRPGDGCSDETLGSILEPLQLRRHQADRGLVSRDGIIPITADQDTAWGCRADCRGRARVLGRHCRTDPADSGNVACLTPGRCYSDDTQLSLQSTRSAERGSRCLTFCTGTNTAGAF